MEAWVGVGSNVGDSVALCTEAMERLRFLFPEGFAASSLYRTSPVGEGLEGEFVNAVCCVYTDLSPKKFFSVLEAIEQDLGKVLKTRGTGNRMIDLDLLLYGEESLQEEGLQIPHPQWADRLFVLIPMWEITPSIVWDGKPISLADKIAALQEKTEETMFVKKIQR